MLKIGEIISHNSSNGKNTIVANMVASTLHWLVHLSVVINTSAWIGNHTARGVIFLPYIAVETKIGRPREKLSTNTATKILNNKSAIIFNHLIIHNYSSSFSFAVVDSAMLSE